MSWLQQLSGNHTASFDDYFQNNNHVLFKCVGEDDSNPQLTQTESIRHLVSQASVYVLGFVC